MMGKEISRVRVEMDVKGEGREAHEYEYCPLWEATKQCKIRPLNGDCNYGLTAIKPPIWCPMRTNTLKMEFSLINQ